MDIKNEEVLVGLSKEELEKYALGIESIHKHVAILVERGLLSEKIAKAVELSTMRAISSESLPSSFKKIPYEIEIPAVSEKVYTETRRAVEATGAFISPIRSLTMKDLIKENEQRERRGEPGRIGHVNSSEAMRNTYPPEMEVFINPKELRIERSNYLSADEQRKKIAEAEARFKEQLPEGVRPFVSFLGTVDPSTYSQLEDRWMDTGKGPLFPDYFARTNVQTVEGRIARVGRHRPNFPRHIDDWKISHGYGNVFIVPVGVLPLKLAA